MATKRILAHYMHESEAQVALQRLSSPQDSGSYVIGDVDDSAIPALEQAGLIVEELPQVPTLRESDTFEAMVGAKRAESRVARSRTAKYDLEATTSAAPSDSSFYY